MFVDAGIPNLTGFVVAGVTGLQQLTVECGCKRANIQLRHVEVYQLRRTRNAKGGRPGEFRALDCCILTTFAAEAASTGVCWPGAATRRWPLAAQYRDEMANIFLSYAREDSVKAAIITRALSARGWTVWWDRSISPGKTFDDVIEDALDEH